MGVIEKRGTTILQGGEPVPVPLCPPQIPHGLSRDRTRASTVRGWRLTAWAMARPSAHFLCRTNSDGDSDSLTYTSSVVADLRRKTRCATTVGVRVFHHRVVTCCSYVYQGTAWWSLHSQRSWREATCNSCGRVDLGVRLERHCMPPWISVVRWNLARDFSFS
jgi:hypothetical protein